MDRIIERQCIDQYKVYLQEEEKSPLTVEKYLRDIERFYRHVPADRRVTRQTVMEYKKRLLGSYKTASVNSMLASANSFFRYMGWEECRIRGVKVQRQIFCREERELTKTEYRRRLQAARHKNERLYLILQTICGTGIRISELSEITAAAVKTGKAEVWCKNKRRLIFLPSSLRTLLKDYLKQEQISAGPVFITRSKHPVDRSNIWKAMKDLCRDADIAAEKLFPHNLRHLFARTCYRQKKDIVLLADILGHSSIETTRIYTRSSGAWHARQMEQLGLVENRQQLIANQ